jgi:hypothetical protein
MLYVFVWVIPQHLKFICRRFGTLCLFHLHRQEGVCTQSVLKRRHINFRRRGITQKKTYNKFYCINIIITVTIILMDCIKKCSHESKDNFDVIITALVFLNLVSLNSNKMLIVTPVHSSSSPISVRNLVSV